MPPRARLAALGTAFALAACARAPESAPPPESTPRPRAVAAVAERAQPRPPLVVIGLDGGDWQLLDRLIAEGRMPELARLVAAGRRFTLESEHPPLSPLLWTTLATGVSPLDHGILDFSRFHPATGAREPIGSDERNAPALWNLATWAGKRAAFFGLWATHPAEPVDGTIVSDRLFGVLHVESAPPPGVVFPPEREARAIETLRRIEREVDHEAMRRFLPDLTADEWAAHAASARAYDHPISALRRILIETRVYDELARAALDELAPDLTFLYLQGTDSIGHVFAPFAPPRQPSISESDFARYSKVPARYFEEIDALLGRYRSWAETKRATLALVSDHGFAWSEGRPERLSSVDNATAAKWHRNEGIALFASFGEPAIAPGRATELAPLRRIAATLVALAGIPAGRDLAAPPLVGAAVGAELPVDYRALFDAERARRVAPSTTAAPAGSSSDEELAKLRALGYLGGAEPDRAPVAAAGSTRTGGSFNNEALILKSLGRRAEAVAAWERALALDPNLASALWNLSDLLYQDGARERSDELLLRALGAGYLDGERETVQRALADHRYGDTARAIALLSRALAVRHDSPQFHLFRGRFLVDGRRCAEALADFAAAERLATADPAAPAAAGMALLCLERPAEARARFERSLVLDPGQPRLRELLERLGAGSGRRP